MKPKKSLRLVIDASVARAAGTSTDPRSASSRRVLEAIREICRQIVLWNEIGAEWDRNQSKFSSRWRTSMFARKKRFVLPECPTGAIRDLIERSDASSSAKRAMMKDAHLVAAARAADGIIVSSDKTARKLFEKASESCPALAVRWVDPSEKDDWEVIGANRFHD